MDREEFGHEINILYLIAKANGDAATGLQLLLMKNEYSNRPLPQADHGFEKMAHIPTRKDLGLE